MMDKRDELYFREVTHTKYKHKPLGAKKDGSRYVNKCIYNDLIDVDSYKGKYVDDKYLVHDGDIKIIFRIFLGFVIFLDMLLFIGDKDLLNGQLYAICLFISFISLTLFLAIASFFHPPFTYIYNRLDGTITMPRMWGKKSYTMQFDDIHFTISNNSGSPYAHSSTGYLHMNHPRWWSFGMCAGAPQDAISFITWFMDKNRPLPKGKAFDPYRQTDYERRKAEGFPEPLYSSYIITEEHTVELTISSYQGRKLNIETIGREQGSEWYNPQKHFGWSVIRYVKDKHDISPLQYELISYEFEDGRIIYARTTENGEVARPPESETFTESHIVGAQLKVTDRPRGTKKEKSIADKWAERNEW